jgi:hypothetical protein
MRVWLCPLEDDDLLAKQGVLGDQRSARANDVAEHTEDGLRNLTKHGRESIRQRLTRIGLQFRDNIRVLGTLHVR